MSETTNQEAYRVLARKYRPQNFDDLIGQEPMVQTLSNAFKTGRIAQAYMLTGVRGVGKTTTARILARALNFHTSDIDKPTMDLSIEGDHCKAIMEGRHVDIIEMDAASHTGIDDIRDIIESVQYAPAIARYKVYIIDEVHMLSRNAFNGLLKTLEEPPEHLKFIFATTEIRKVPITVLSRCQRFDLRRIEGAVMVNHLKKIADLENVEVEDDALAMIARASEGSVRDALSMFDQAIAHSIGDGELAGAVEAEKIRSMLGLADRARVIDLFENVMSGNIAAALSEIKEQYDIGADPYVVLTDLADFIHFVTRLKYADGTSGISDLGHIGNFSEMERTRGKEFADKLSIRVLGRAWQILLKGLSEVQTSERALAAADMVLVRLTHSIELPSHEELVKQVENGQNAGSGAPAGGAPTMLSSGSDATATKHMPSNAPVQFTPKATIETQHSSSQPPQLANENLAIKTDAKQNETQKPQRQVNSFDELIFLTEDKRDLKAKSFLKRHFKLVECRHGYLEYQQAGNPPREMLQYLGKKLEEWTGTRWTLVVSQKEGMPTLDEIERAEMQDKLDNARSHPAVDAIMKTFDGARIVDVRIKNEEDGVVEIIEEEDDENLDDFFE